MSLPVPASPEGPRRMVDPNECDNPECPNASEHPHRYGPGCVTSPEGPDEALLLTVEKALAGVIGTDLLREVSLAVLPLLTAERERTHADEIADDNRRRAEVSAGCSARAALDGIPYAHNYTEAEIDRIVGRAAIAALSATDPGSTDG